MNAEPSRLVRRLGLFDAVVAHCNARSSAQLSAVYPESGGTPAVRARPLDMTHRVAHRAEVAVGVLVATVVLVADLRGAIGFSSFAVLTYYAIANASAWTLPSDQRRWPRPIAALGVVGCVVLAFTLPSQSVVGGLVVLALGATVWLVRTRASTRASG